VTLSSLLDAPFYVGGSAAADVPSLYDCSLNGRPYMIDLEAKQGIDFVFSHQTVPRLRQQADQGTSPSEASLNPDDLWRRSQDSWHDGAGQAFLDRTESDPARYDTSKGVDVWDKWQLSLLNDTTRKVTSVNTNLQLLTAGDYLYLCDGSTLQFTTNITTGAPVWQTVFSPYPGLDTSQITSIATDGYTVYATQPYASGGVAGVYAMQRGSIAQKAGTVPFNALVCTLLRYVKGRLMAANNNVIYNITSSSVPAALYTHPNADFHWVDFAEGTSVLYAAGYSGDKSIIYKTAVVADGSSLSIPTVAAQLPDGEVVQSMTGYLGFLLIGTNQGVRLATADSVANLTLGSLIPTDNPVLCFEAQDRFVWYGLTNYDSTSTGLGRTDLSSFTASTTPAYASDLMATAQGNVTSVVTFQDVRVFAVDGQGVYCEAATPVSSGSLDSGQITYKLPDAKVAMFVDVHADNGSVEVSISTDGGPFVSLGTHADTAATFVCEAKRGARFNIRLTLTATNAVSPVVRSFTLRSYPTATTSLVITAPLLLSENLQLNDQSEAGINPTTELNAIRDLRAAQVPVTWKESSGTYTVMVEDYEWRPHHQTIDRSGWNGTVTVRMKAIQ
jgi:hypothetical protein